LSPHLKKLIVAACLLLAGAAVLIKVVPIRAARGDVDPASAGMLTVPDVQTGPTLTVTTTDDHDDGACTTDDCSLREAINAANTLAGTETITFDPSLKSGGAAVINLTSPLPIIFSDMNITGPGAKLLTVNGISASECSSSFLRRFPCQT